MKLINTYIKPWTTDSHQMGYQSYGVDVYGRGGSFMTGEQVPTLIDVMPSVHGRIVP